MARTVRTARMWRVPLPKKNICAGHHGENVGLQPHIVGVATRVVKVAATCWFGSEAALRDLGIAIVPEVALYSKPSHHARVLQRRCHRWRCTQCCLLVLLWPCRALEGASRNYEFSRVARSERVRVRATAAGLLSATWALRFCNVQRGAGGRLHKTRHVGRNRIQYLININLSKDCSETDRTVISQ